MSITIEHTRTVNFKVAVFLSTLLLFSSACGSSRDEEPAPPAAEEASQVVLEAVTATTVPSSSEAASDAENGAENEAGSEDVAVAAAETPPIPPTSTAIPIPATSGSGASAQASLGGILPSRIQIPSISLDTPVVELSWHAAESDDGQIFSEWDVADQAAGWHKNSSMVGENGNVVLSGHNNILGAVFRELDQLKRGDEALLSTDDGVQRYLIDKVMIVPEKYATQEQREANAAWIGHFEDDRLTLVSCWPRDDNSHRIIVVAYADDSEPTVSN